MINSAKTFFHFDYAKISMALLGAGFWGWRWGGGVSRGGGGGCGGVGSLLGGGEDLITSSLLPEISSALTKIF